MKKKKCIAAGALAAFLLCESLFTPNLAGMGAGLLKVQAAAANVALNKEVTSSANESATWSADKAVDGAVDAFDRFQHNILSPRVT